MFKILKNMLISALVTLSLTANGIENAPVKGERPDNFAPYNLTGAARNLLDDFDDEIVVVPGGAPVKGERPDDRAPAPYGAVAVRLF
jgi:hypothetical protein